MLVLCCSWKTSRTKKRRLLLHSSWKKQPCWTMRSLLLCCSWRKQACWWREGCCFIVPKTKHANKEKVAALLLLRKVHQHNSSTWLARNKNYFSSTQSTCITRRGAVKSHDDHDNFDGWPYLPPALLQQNNNRHALLQYEGVNWLKLWHSLLQQQKFQYSAHPTYIPYQGISPTNW